MLVGIHSRSNDLTVNPTKAKQLTNIRAAGTDENLILSTPVPVTLEYALEFKAAQGPRAQKSRPRGLRRGSEEPFLPGRI